MTNIILTTNGEDGIDHINIHATFAKTELGIQLSSTFHYAFLHPILGPFESIENFIAWVRAGGTCDELRFAKEKRLRTLIKQHKKIKIKDFYKVLVDGFLTRIKNDVQLTELIKQNDLPFTLYYLHNGNVRVPVIGGKLFVKALEKARQLIKDEHLSHETFTPNYRDFLPEVFHDN